MPLFSLCPPPSSPGVGQAGKAVGKPPYIFVHSIRSAIPVKVQPRNEATAGLCCRPVLRPVLWNEGAGAGAAGAKRLKRLRLLEKRKERGRPGTPDRL